MSGVWDSIPEPKKRPEKKHKPMEVPEPQVDKPKPKEPQAKIAEEPEDKEPTRWSEEYLMSNNETNKNVANTSVANIKPEFVEVLRDREYVLYGGLLDAAHSKGLRSIHTDLLQVPNEEHPVAIVKAIVMMEDGREFTGIGDASPKSVTMKNIVPHIIRIAETRAKARALRDAINVGTAAIEELGEGNEEYLKQAAQ